jgi:hypothetical protein
VTTTTMVMVAVMGRVIEGVDIILKIINSNTSHFLDGSNGMEGSIPVKNERNCDIEY